MTTPADTKPPSARFGLAPTPDFIVGQNRLGQWVAVERQGHGGGLFASRDAALHYAALESARRSADIPLSEEPVELPI